MDMGKIAKNVRAYLGLPGPTSKWGRLAHDIVFNNTNLSTVGPTWAYLSLYLYIFSIGRYSVVYRKDRKRVGPVGPGRPTEALRGFKWVPTLLVGLPLFFRIFQNFGDKT